MPNVAWRPVELDTSRRPRLSDRKVDGLIRSIVQEEFLLKSLVKRTPDFPAKLRRDQRDEVPMESV